jgi:hypothetical protein
MLPVLAACSTAAACAGVEIGPPLWMLATAMIAIFVLLIGGAIAIGAVYRRRAVSGPASTAPSRPAASRPAAARPAPATTPAAPWADEGRRRR